MLKYTEVEVTFSEVPDEISLCINITGCKNSCPGCHSPHLAEDIGEELTFDTLLKLCAVNSGISCVAFMGGDSNPFYINKLAEILKEGELNLKVAWYSGRQELSPEINLRNFDYIKIGPYIEELGPLNSKTTNQRFYKIIGIYYEDGTEGYELEDITYKFWK